MAATVAVVASLTVAGCTTGQDNAAVTNSSAPLSAGVALGAAPGNSAPLPVAPTAASTRSSSAALAAVGSASGKIINCDDYVGTVSSAKLSAVGEGNPEQSLFKDILGKLGENALDWSEGEGLGWLLSLLTGEQGDKVQLDEIQKEVQETNKSIGDLKMQVSDLQTDLAADVKQIMTAIEQNNYQQLISNLNTPITDISSVQTGYDLMKLNHSNHPGTPLTTEDTDNLAKWRSLLTHDIDAFVQVLNPHQPLQDSPIAVYDDLLWKKLPGYQDSTNRKIMPYTYVNPAYDQVDYYSSLLTQATNLLSEVYHVSWTGYDEHTDVVSTYTKCANALVADMSDVAAHGVGRIPQHTVVDDRTSNPLMWTNSAVALDGDPGHSDFVNSADPATPATDNFYCLKPSDFCLVQQYDQQGQVATTTFTRPATGPIGSLLTAQQPLGYNDWHVPSTAEWTALQQGATGGLSNWAVTQGLGLFKPVSVASYSGGRAATVTVIPPVWVNTAEAGKTPIYGLLTSADPTSNVLTLRSPASTAFNQVAGRLFLVRKVQTDDVSTTRNLPTQSRSGKAEQITGKRTVAAGPNAINTPAACSNATAYQVPDGVSALQVVASGGAGADGLENNSPSAKGGAGAVVSATIPVAPGTTVYYQVGGAGNGQQGGVGGGSNGGDSHLWTKNSGDRSGGGGGFTGISSTSDCSNWLIVAAGGGGGGAGATETCCGIRYVGGNGGAGSATQGVPSSGISGTIKPGYAQSSGQAGTGVSGGAAGRDASNSNLPLGTAGTAGTAGKGGTGGNASGSYPGGGGGGGGGGLFGGGAGGGGWYGAGGGGAGGASFAPTGSPVTPTITAGTAGQSGSLTITPLTDRVTIASGATGWVANIYRELTADGTAVDQYPRTNTDNATWQYLPTTGQVTNPASDKCLTVTGDALVVLSTCTSSAAQTWKLDAVGFGSQTLTSGQDPSKVLAVSDVSPAATKQLGLHTFTEDPSQFWSVQDASWPDD